MRTQATRQAEDWGRRRIDGRPGPWHLWATSGPACHVRWPYDTEWAAVGGPVDDEKVCARCQVLSEANR